MDEKNKKQSEKRNWLYWFDPRGKSFGSYGFMVNRIAGLGLTLYLFMHFVMLGKLINGEAAYDSFIHLAHQPVIVAGEFLVVLAVLLHGINGIRIGVTSFGIGNKIQKGLLYAAFFLAITGSIFFAVKMFGGA
jgi:succinate dehydrogenase / fumarate reductase, cytochrome b subunit